jgi:2-polyprenyl-6-methoxyphenol hydroxylase-like FAD-dependent oxidoreductase
MGMKLFDDLDVLGEMTKLGTPLKAPEMDTVSGEVLAVLETGLLAEPRLNYSLLLGPSEIRQVLREKALSQGIELMEGVSFREAIRSSDGRKIVGAKFERDGESFQISSDVLIGADGYKSRVRDNFGARVKERTYPAIAGFFLNYEHGLDRMKMILGDGCQMVVLPCTKTKLSLGYTERGLSVERLSREDGVDYVRQKMARSAPFLKDVIETRINPDDETTLFIEPKAIRVEPWYVDGGVIIGDAAHAFHPGTGMGAQQAFIDAVTLSSILGEGVKRKDFSVSLLRGFEDQRRPFMNLLESTNNRNISMQLAKGSFSIWMRNRSIRALAKLIERRGYQEIITGVRPPTRLETMRLMTAFFVA